YQGPLVQRPLRNADAVLDEAAVDALPHVDDVGLSAGPREAARVGDLSAALGVEDRARGDEEALLTLVQLGRPRDERPVLRESEERQDRSLLERDEVLLRVAAKFRGP